MKSYDRIIIGAGLYGLYSALFCAEKGMSVLVLECDSEPFKRATYINQARVHMGYHYPRSLTTALKSAGYFRRFNEDFGFCIHSSFQQIYATSARFSYTSAPQFTEFCKAADIMCREVPVSAYFNDGMCDGAFLTEEYTYDAHILRDYYIDKLSGYPDAEIIYNASVENIYKENDSYVINISDKREFKTAFLLNATYASVNQILAKIKNNVFFNIKYELCEIILCKPSKPLEDIGITVMDGPFFSIMPFGKTGLHSLTAVTFTPHMTCYESLPEFKCQTKLKESGSSFLCSREKLNNCNDCPVRPKSSYNYMSRLADKYIKPEFGYEYSSSLFSMKPILKSSEVDDSRPTAIKVLSKAPTFISVLSGKINTVYDLDGYLLGE